MIATARLLLRPPGDGDLAWALEHTNTPAVMRHLGGVRSAEQVAEGFARNVAAFAEGRWGFWTVWRRDSEERVGKCGLAVIDTASAPDELQGKPQVGWTLAEHCWGQGFASEAASAVIKHGLTDLGLPAIFAQTSASNGASTRMMARLGFDRLADLDYVDPDYPAADNPTTVYRREAS